MIEANSELKEEVDSGAGPFDLHQCIFDNSIL